MLADRLVNLPSAAHSLRKHNKISSPKADGLSPIGCHRHLSVQQQTGFTLVVSPGECADVAAPNRPVTQPKRQDRALGARRCDADHRDTSADVSDSLISGRLTIPNTASPRAKAVASEYDAERPNSYGSASYDCDIGPLRPLYLDEVATVDRQRVRHLGD